MASQKGAKWQERGHFFAISSQQMRRILVDAARSRMRQKRGSDAVVVSLEASVIVGWPPERTNFWSTAVYSACWAVPRRPASPTMTPPCASTRLSCWFPEPASPPAAGPEDILDDDGAPGAVTGERNMSRLRDSREPCSELAVTPPSRCTFPWSLKYVRDGAWICHGGVAGRGV